MVKDTVVSKIWREIEITSAIFVLHLLQLFNSRRDRFITLQTESYYASYKRIQLFLLTDLDPVSFLFYKCDPLFSRGSLRFPLEQVQFFILHQKLIFFDLKRSGSTKNVSLDSKQSIFRKNPRHPSPSCRRETNNTFYSALRSPLFRKIQSEDKSPSWDSIILSC